MKMFGERIFPIGNRMGPSKIKVKFHACFQSFTKLRFECKLQV